MSVQRYSHVHLWCYYCIWRNGWRKKNISTEIHTEIRNEISSSDLDVYIDPLKTCVNEFYDGFTGMGGGRVTFDLCSPVIPFSSSARLCLKVFLYLQKQTNKQKNKRERLWLWILCAEVWIRSTGGQHAVDSTRTSQSRHCVLSLWKK